MLQIDIVQTGLTKSNPVRDPGWEKYLFFNCEFLKKPLHSHFWRDVLVYLMLFSALNQTSRFIERVLSAALPQRLSWKRLNQCKRKLKVERIEIKSSGMLVKIASRDINYTWQPKNANRVVCCHLCRKKKLFFFLTRLKRSKSTSTKCND